MPKHNYVMSLIRGLGSDGLKKIFQTGKELISPHLGELILKTGGLLSKHVPGIRGKTVESLVDSALRATPAILNTAEKMLEDSLTEPNATVVPKFAASRAAALFPANVPDVAPNRGLLFFGDSQPAALYKQPAPVLDVEYTRRGLLRNQFASELPKIEYVPVSDKTSFNPGGAYLGDHNNLRTGAPSNASEAGWYFRKVGPGTNIKDYAPGFGETENPQIAIPKIVDKKIRSHKKRKAKIPEKLVKHKKKH
jgi:hypothetical protein